MSKILFIVEGLKDEPKYLQQFIKFHDEKLLENGNKVIPIIVQSYGTLVYDLYKRISAQFEEDEFETIPVLTEIFREKNIEYDKSLDNSEDFSDVYLFFDLDAHYNLKRSNRNEKMYKKIKELVDFFKESTEKGKLLISYPMFEALQCFDDGFLLNNEVLLHTFNIYDVKKGKSTTTFKKVYKNINSADSIYRKPDYCYEKIENLTKYFIATSLYLVKDINEINNSTIIFQRQYNKFIDLQNEVVVLSAFPHFLVDIFGVDIFYSGEKYTYRCEKISEENSK